MLHTHPALQITPLQRTAMLNAATTWVALANQGDRDLARCNLQDQRDRAQWYADHILIAKSRLTRCP